MLHCLRAGAAHSSPCRLLNRVALRHAPVADPTPSSQAVRKLADTKKLESQLNSDWNDSK